MTVPHQPLDLRADEDRKWRPPDSRLALVDAIRAYALMGLFLLHVEQQFELYWAAPKPSWSTTVVFGLFAGKTFSLLALSFGFSFFMMLEEGAGRRISPSRFAWRLTILAAIGSLHGAVYRGDIIVVLALCGFVLIPIHYVRSKTVLCAIAAVCFAQPYILAWIVAGLAGAAWALKPAEFVSDSGNYLTGGLGEVLLGNLGPGQASKWWFYYETGRIMQVIGLFIMGLLLGTLQLLSPPEQIPMAAHDGAGRKRGRRHYPARSPQDDRKVRLRSFLLDRRSHIRLVQPSLYGNIASGYCRVLASGRGVRVAPAFTGRPHDADIICRPIAFLRAAVLSLRPWFVRASVPGRGASARSRRRDASTSVRRGLVFALPIWTSRVAMAMRHMVDMESANSPSRNGGIDSAMAEEQRLVEITGGVQPRTSIIRYED